MKRTSRVCENCGIEIFAKDNFKKHQLVCTGGKKCSSMEDKVMAVLADLGIERMYKQGPPSASPDVTIVSFDHPTYQFDKPYKVRSKNFFLSHHKRNAAFVHRDER
jgi:hypothetical protein